MVKDIEKIIKAYEFAKEAHKNQKRETGEPYITHPVAVANIAAEYDGDDNTICACLLHHYLENNPMSFNKLKENFGPAITLLVFAQTKYNKADEGIEKLAYMATKTDPRPIMIELANRIHDTQTTKNITKKYIKSNKKYIELGREFGYEEMADRLESLTSKIRGK